MTKPAYLTTTQIASRFGVSYITAVKWVQRGLFANAHKVGRDWLIPEGEVAAFTLPKRGKPHRTVKECNCGHTPHKSNCPVYLREAQRRYRAKKETGR